MEVNNMSNKLDKYNLRRVILREAEQFKEGLEIAKNIKMKGEFKSITISGMGGSALPGNILRIFLSDLFNRDHKHNSLAVYQNRTYSLPREAYDNSLNIICSFSGNTEETISSFQEALDNGLPCVGISSGGKVEEMCQKNGIHHIKMPIPYENFQPRMATGYFFAVIFKILINANLIKDISGEIVETADELTQEIKNLEDDGKKLATRLVGKTPIIYSSIKFKSVAMIWKIKINENAKTPAFWNFFPELNHNEMVGFTNPQANFIFVMLKDDSGDSENLKRFDMTAKLMRKKGMEAEIITIKKGNIFYEIFSTLYLGDWTSYYLALEYGQDPTPVDMVEDFKKLIA